MLTSYREHVAERAAQGLPPLPLSERQTRELCKLLCDPPAGEAAFLLELLRERVPPGVDGAARVKAECLALVARGVIKSPLLGPEHAVAILGTMLGGYNVSPLVELLEHDRLGPLAAEQLGRVLLVFSAFERVVQLAQGGNVNARRVLDTWAAGEWFESRPAVSDRITLRVFKAPGETTTDDLSPAQEAWSRPDIPRHALGLRELAELRKQGYPVAYAGDVVGTGSSRKSAVNSLLFHIGSDIPHVPNKRSGGVVLGGKIAPIFFNTLLDSGALPIECDVSRLAMGDLIHVYPRAGVIEDERGAIVARFAPREALLDAVRAGGRIPLIIGRNLTARARQVLGLGPSTLFRSAAPAPIASGGYTLAQKIIGRACGLPGVRPGQYCEPRVSSVGSQDTTGPMTRDELKELACLRFEAELVLQTFCHTVAYPRPADIETQQSLPDFFVERGGVALRPGDGIIHSWLNRMLLPDQVGTGADSHTRFPLGISFPAGSGLVAFAAALGVMPLDVPESVLVRFKGEMRPFITLRDLVNAIPWVALKSGDLTLAKQGKTNVFNGRILEIEGLPDLKVEQAFELSDASAERSAAACTIRLGREPVLEYLKSNVALLRGLIARGYGDATALERRARAMEAWIADPELLEPDPDASYARVFEIDLASIEEPLVACPNDPDDVRPLSAVAGTVVDEVFLGSCMTNVGHFRAAASVLDAHGGPVPARLWVAPPTRMDRAQLMREGRYSSFAQAGARTEVPGCSLCMGNQARVRPNATVFSTSTRNFPNRMGEGAKVFLGSAELAAVVAVLGKLPTLEEYLAHTQPLVAASRGVYRYLDFAADGGGAAATP